MLGFSKHAESSFAPLRPEILHLYSRNPRALSSLASRRFLRERFQVLESQEAAGAAPAVASVLALTRGLKRSEAAKLFYQVCGAPFLCRPCPSTYFGFEVLGIQGHNAASRARLC